MIGIVKGWKGHFLSFQLTSPSPAKGLADTAYPKESAAEDGGQSD
jgi:hypothetical protein